MTHSWSLREFYPLGHGDCLGKGITQTKPMRVHPGAFLGTAGKVKEALFFPLHLKIKWLEATMFGRPA